MEGTGIFLSALAFELTAVLLVYNPCIQSVSQSQLYSQFQLNLRSDPNALCVPTSTWCWLVMIQCARHLPDILRNMLRIFQHFLCSKTKWKVTFKLKVVISKRRWWQNWQKIHLCIAYIKVHFVMQILSPTLANCVCLHGEVINLQNSV